MRLLRDRPFLAKAAAVSLAVTIIVFLGAVVWRHGDGPLPGANPTGLGARQDNLQNGGSGMAVGGTAAKVIGAATQSVLLAKAQRFAPLIISAAMILAIGAVVAGIAIYYGTLEAEQRAANESLVNDSEERPVVSKNTALIIFVLAVWAVVATVIAGTGIYCYRAMNRPPPATTPVPKPDLRLAVSLEKDQVLGGRFKLLSVIGHGGNGRVWEALDLQTGQLVAVKQVIPDKLLPASSKVAKVDPANKDGDANVGPPPKDGDANVDPKNKDTEEKAKRVYTARLRAAVKELQRESKLLQGLHHDNIIQHTTYLEDVNALVMEHLGEPSKTHLRVEDRIKNFLKGVERTFSPMKEGELKSYMRQLLSAVDYLHDNEIMHLDIKPGNVLMTHDRQTVKLIDFGLARSFKEPGGPKGTTMFMAPEMLDAPYRFNEKADIWSIGITAIDLLNVRPYGHLPRTTRDEGDGGGEGGGGGGAVNKEEPKDNNEKGPQEKDEKDKLKDEKNEKDPQEKKQVLRDARKMAISAKIKTGNYPRIPTSVSKGCQEFIRKCLTVDPDARPSAKELLHTDPWLNSDRQQ